ncbi:serine/threonine protein kinase [Candidatus Uabimicrobium sp. HlEnr_7]|uniref:serine/threonine protein kinase n=1 Tax=Candidatus Uabimicrobium helgolandensis TaxID=3095367 RepID=UPI0035577936
MSIRIGDYEVFDCDYRVNNVFQAISVEDEHLYAMKIFPHKRLPKSETILCFQQQAEKLIPMQHKNIIRIYDHGTFKNTLYYVMEYIEGTTLTKSIYSRGHFEEKQALRIALQIVSAVQYMSQRGFVCYDITPSNIMITKNNSKIFNLIKVNQKDHLVTAFEEECEGEMKERNNIFTIGMILYYMLTATFTSIKEGSVELLSNMKEKNPRVSELTCEIVTRMATVGKKVHYPNYATIINDLLLAVTDDKE